MSILSFEKEFKEYFKELNTPLKVFLAKEYRKSNRNSYYGFFDDFLLKYGIVSFNSVPFVDGPKFIPYLNCREKNIFNLSGGMTDITKMPHTLLEANRLIAKYLIDKLNATSVNTYENWSEY
ncbi:hypothetical protein [Myroides guanonis]|uniref:Uncharacterized protein n=1 Tax=Myroides guanonis TaxID=1150112 RepID=A0A1I3PN40_9FLAO|nr:hypothetical protein [Myroides guanonis]SFJ22978.1 hypothetical protein SAMN04487893_104186 [Myroides guanonis]